MMYACTKELLRGRYEQVTAHANDLRHQLLELTAALTEAEDGLA